jgi:hypothetical protein
MELRFRVPYGTDVTLGEIVVGEDETTGRRFLVRVVDLFHGTEATADDWPERVAGSMLRLDDDGESYDLHDRPIRLYQVAQAAPMGFLETGPHGRQRLRRPKTLPWHFSRLRRVREADLEFMAGYGQDVLVGRLRSGGHVVGQPVGLRGDLLAHHVGVFATTGMGKSNLMKTFSASLMATRRYGMLMLDPHGEYYDGGAGTLEDGRPLQGLKDAPDAAERMAVYSSRKLGGPYNQLRVSAYEVSVSDVRNIYKFSLAQEEALYAVRGAFGAAWLVELAERQTDELVADFGNRIREETFAVLKRRAERILGFDAVHGDPTVTVSRDVVDQVRQAKLVLVDTSSLGESEELLVSAVLARALFAANKTAYKDRDRFEKLPPMAIAMEEAQRVLVRREGESSVFAQIAREGRKFKTGLVAVTQQPKLVPEELLSQFNTFFVLGLADERDRSIIASSAKQDLGSILKEIQTLEPGEAVITSPAVPFAVPAMVDLYEDWLAAHPPAATAKAARSANGGDGFY